MRDFPNGRSPGWGSGSFFRVGFLLAIVFRRWAGDAREPFPRALAEHFSAGLLSACRRADVECRLSPSRYGSSALLSRRTQGFARARTNPGAGALVSVVPRGVYGTQVTRALSSLTMTSLSGATKKPWLLAGRLSSVTPSAVLTVQPTAVLTA